MRAVRDDARPFAPSAPRSDRLADSVAGNGIVLAGVVSPLLLRGSVERKGSALIADLESVDLRRDRRDRRRSHHIATRAARRRAQLGLPLLLAARCHADPDGAGVRGLS